MIRAYAMAVILTTAVTACGTSSDPELVASLPQVVPQPGAALTVCELLAEPDRYDGATVLVKGTLRRGIEAAYLAGAGCPEQPPICLFLDEMRAIPAYIDKLWTVPQMDVVMRATLRHQAPCDFGSDQPRLDVQTVENVSEASANDQEPRPLRE